MAFPFQTELGSDNPRWSVKIVDPQNDVAATVPYIFLKETTKATGFPIRIFKIVQRFLTDQITLVELISRLANVCMIEAGFVPIYHDDPALPVEELKSLSVNDKLIRLIDVLSRILHEQGHLRLVKYTFIKLPTEECPAPAYSSDLVMLTAIQDDNQIQAVASGCNHSELYQLDCDLFMTNVGELLKQKHHALNFVYSGNFDAMKFVGILKPNFIYPLLDALEGESPEVKGMDDLPEEILEKMAAYLDGKSFVKLMASSSRNLHALDKDYLWEIMYNKIDTDFADYNMPCFQSVYRGVNQVNSFREKYKFIIEASLRLLERANVTYSYEFQPI